MTASRADIASAKYYKDVAIDLFDIFGLEPLPIPPYEKYPVGLDSWNSVQIDQNWIQERINNGESDYGVGIRLHGAAIALDVDVRDPDLAKALHKHLGSLVDGLLPCRIGQSPKFLVPCTCPDITKKITSRKYIDQEGKDHKIEILTTGEQYVAFGLHQDTRKPYKWYNGDPTTIGAGPNITLDEIEDFISLFEAEAEAREWTAPERPTREGGGRGPINKEACAENIVMAADFHDSTRDLAFALIRDGEAETEVVRYIESLYDKVSPDQRDPLRFDKRRGDIGRLVRSAIEKVDRKNDKADPDVSQVSAKCQPDQPADSTQSRPLLSDEDFAPLDKWLITQPPERKYIIDDLIAEDITVALNSSGGVGKSNLVFLMCACVASGISVEPFKVGMPRKVLLVNVEDGTLDLWRRFYALGQVYPQFKENAHTLRQNLKAYPARGLVRPLMYLDQNKPKLSEDGIWMYRSMMEIRPEFAVFDTKSRLYGLDENNNDHAAQWWGLFERVITELDNGLSTMVAAHTSKQRAGQATQHSNRGAAAFIDNARLNIVLTPMDDKEAELHDVEQIDYFAMSAPKSNYTRVKNKTWFKRSDKEGIPVYDNLTAGRFFGAVNLLVELIKELPDQRIKKRDLEQRSGVASKIREAVKDEFGFEKKDIKTILAGAVQDDKLVLVEERQSVFIEPWNM